MKRAFIVAVVAFLAITGSVRAEAPVISFVWDPPTYTFQNVDGDTSNWSKTDAMVNLNTSSWSLWNGMAQVSAYSSGQPASLTQRGTRGLGILGGENDEIDSYNYDVEKLVITFKEPVPLYAFEVRSLFYEDDLLPNGDHKERGVANFWLGDNNVFNQCLVGVENIETPGTKGIVDYSYLDNPYTIDKIVFQVPVGKWYTNNSEFSVASLTVPEPISTILFLTGGSVMGLRIYRKKRANSKRR